MREKRGRTGGFDDGSFCDLVEIIGDEVSLDTIRRFVSVSTVDRFGASWDERFGELVAYREKHGHLRISQYVGEHKSLARWVVTQRSSYKRGQLCEDRVQRLESLGFQWSGVIYAEIWEQRYEELKAFWEEHGHCNVSQYDPEHSRLGRWVTTQRRSWMKGRISRKRVQLLEAINFQWIEQSNAELWDERYKELKTFWREYGHFRVSTRNPETRTLGIWVIFQRQQRRKGELSDERIKRLDAIGFDWSPSGNRREIWDTRVEQLKAYREGQEVSASVQQVAPRQFPSNP